jgi:hypothetical protein
MPAATKAQGGQAAQRDAEYHDARVQRQIELNGIGLFRHHGKNGGRGSARDEPTDQRRDNSDDRAFRQLTAHESKASGAERDAKRELAAARGRAGR